MRKKLGVVDAIGIIFLSKLIWLGDHSIFFGDPGLGWHLRAGEWIAANAGAPLRDPFLFLSQDTPWIHNQWLSDFFIWLGFQLGGMDFLLVAAVGACLAPYIAVLSPSFAKGKHSMLATVLGLLLVLLTAAVQWLLRPVLLSFLLFSLVYLLCGEQYRRDELYRPIWCVPLVFLLWANLHPAFVLGLALLAALLISVVFRGFLSSSNTEVQPRLAWWLLIIAGLASLATLCTPYGLDLHRSIFSLVGSRYFMNLNREWLAPSIANPAFWPFALVAIFFLLSLLFASSRKRISLFEYLVGAGLLFVSLQQRRYIPFFAIASCVPTIVALDTILQRFELPALKRLRNREQDTSCCRYVGILWFALLFLIFVRGPGAVLQNGTTLASSLYPNKLISRLKESPNRLSGRVFHSPDFGGYLIWHIWPEKLVYIDDRNVLNGQAKYADYFSMRAAEESGLKLFDQYQFEWALIERRSPLATHLLASKWSLEKNEGEFLLLRSGVEEHDGNRR